VLAREEISDRVSEYYFFHRLLLSTKSKGLPQQAEVAQGVPGRLRPRTFLTFLHYKGGRSSAKPIGRLYPRRNPWYSLSEAESTSRHMVLSGVPRKKSPVTPPGTVRLVAQCLNHYATPGPYYCLYFILFGPNLIIQLQFEIPSNHRNFCYFLSYFCGK
jgi:hypothetical protein